MLEPKGGDENGGSETEDARGECYLMTIIFLVNVSPSLRSR